MKTAIAIAAAAATAFSAFAAQAGDYSFAYSPDELASSRGVADVYNRIENKAESFCGNNDRASLRSRFAKEECVAEVTRDLVAKIGDARLAAHGETRLASRN